MEHRTNTDKKSTIDFIREELKVEDQWLEISIKKQKLKYFGHLKRSEGLGKTVLEGKTDGKRERGRPRGQWERNIQNDFDMPITEIGRLTMDRNYFHCKVKDATSCGDNQL